MAGLSAVLLDTCAVIWLANGDPISDEANQAISGAVLAGGALVSPVSAWEVGMLAQRPRPIVFLPDPTIWFGRFLARAGVRLAPLTPGIAIAASVLPGDLHRDPADRLLIATARDLGVPVVTRDRLLLAYAGAGFVRAIAC